VIGDDEYGVATTEDGSIKVYAPGEDMSDPTAGVRFPPGQTP
jgi:hypothetical protein